MSLFFPDGLPVVLGFPPFPFPILNIPSKNIKELLEICSEIKPEKFSLVTKSTHIHVFFKYILCLIIILFQHNPVKEDQCYVCKRTENEVMELLISNLGPIAKKYASEIIQITSILKKVEDDLKSHVDAVLKIIENVRDENLEFSLMDTLFDSRTTFKKVIPNIDELEKIQNQYMGGKISHNSPFSITRDYFMEIRKHMDDKNSKEHLEDLKNFQSRVMRNLELEEHMHGLNLKFFKSDGRITRPEQAESEKENKKIVESINALEKLIDEEIYHGVTSNQQLKSIEKLTHRKIFRSVLSSDGFFPKIGTEVSQRSDAYARGNLPGEIIQTQFSIDVCAICYTLVWHEPLVVLKKTPPLQTRPPPIEWSY